MTTAEDMQRLVSRLSMPDSDHWSDEACNEARALLDAGGEPLLDELLRVVQDLSPLQQGNLAYILGESNFTGELEILQLLKNSEHAEVSHRAREALRGLR